MIQNFAITFPIDYPKNENKGSWPKSPGAYDLFLRKKIKMIKSSYILLNVNKALKSLFRFASI
jgi:hypothetical protein